VISSSLAEDEPSDTGTGQVFVEVVANTGVMALNAVLP
jgi:hypothetical protein